MNKHGETADLSTNERISEEAPRETAFGSRRERRRAILHMLFVDHAFFRYAYLNLHEVGPGAYRSAQPAPRHVRLYQRLGVKTVINLRGAVDLPVTRLEKEACAKAGIAYRETILKSRQAPKPESVEAAAQLLDEVAYPVVWHCKAGADRAGLMSAIYLLSRQKTSAQEARRQLSLRYGHFRAGPTGVLDLFVDHWAAAEKAAAARGETLNFRDWVRDGYDPEALREEFHASRWGTWLVDTLLKRE